jgi:dephospho-CoA kinase
MPLVTPLILSRYCDRYAIGLTGGIASGKSTVATRFATLGAAVVDTDVVAHELTAPQGEAMPAIEQAFGKDYLNSDGSLNRAAMRALVFAQPEQRKVLEGILHPMIHHRTQALGNTVAGSYVVFVVPLLVESSQWRGQVDRIAVVDCDPALQQARLVQRPGLNTEQATQIMAAQAARETRLGAADDVIANHADTLALLRRVNSLHCDYLQQSEHHTHTRA